MAVYGVATDNPFALLGDEDGDEDERDADDAPKRADPPPTTKQKTTTPSQTGKGGTVRGGRRSEAPVREQTNEGEYGGGGEGWKGSYASRPGTTPRGGARGRGGGGGRSKRQYDRRDGTGRGHEFEKRHGGGKGNWGVSGETDVPAEQTVVGWGVVDEKPADGQPTEGEVKEEKEEPDAEGAEAEEKEETKQEEPKPVYTLAEYEEMMKQQGGGPMTPAKKEMPSVDKKQFDGMAVLKKSDEGSGFEGLEVEKTRKKKERSQKEIETVEVAFRVGDPVRRGRGRGRGRSRDFDREGEPPQRAVNGAGGPSEMQRTESGGSHPRPFRGRGRGRFRGRSTYGDQAGRGAGRRGVDIASEQAFPSLTG